MTEEIFRDGFTTQDCRDGQQARALGGALVSQEVKRRHGTMQVENVDGAASPCVCRCGKSDRGGGRRLHGRRAFANLSSACPASRSSAMPTTGRDALALVEKLCPDLLLLEQCRSSARRERHRGDAQAARGPHHVGGRDRDHVGEARSTRSETRCTSVVHCHQSRSSPFADRLETYAECSPPLATCARPTVRHRRSPLRAAADEQRGVAAQGISADAHACRLVAEALRDRALSPELAARAGISQGVARRCTSHSSPPTPERSTSRSAVPRRGSAEHLYRREMPVSRRLRRIRLSRQCREYRQR